VAAFSLAKPSIASVWPPQIISTTQVNPVLLFRTVKTGGSDILQPTLRPITVDGMGDEYADADDA
jgi:hypothetical protein